MSEVFYTLADFAIRIITSVWFWIILITAAVLILTVFLYTRIKIITLEELIYSRSFSTDGVFVGETLELIETISNPTWFPLFAVNMEFFIPSGLTVDGVTCNEYTKLTSVFNIPPFSTVRKTHLVKVDRRDHYKLSTSYIMYRAFEYTFDSAIDFFAYPNPYDVNIRSFNDIFYAGEAISNRKYIEDPLLFSGIRDYRLGDPMRLINYKASVRSFSGGQLHLMCNEYDSSRNYDSMVFLDLTAAHNTEQVELGLQYACYLFSLGINNGGSVGFCTNCTLETSRYIHIPCGNSILHTKLVLEQFAEISPYSKRAYSMTGILQNHALQLSKETDIYYIAPSIDNKTAEVISTLQHMGRNVQVIPLPEGDRK